MRSPRIRRPDSENNVDRLCACIVSLSPPVSENNPKLRFDVRTTKEIPRFAGGQLTVRTCPLLVPPLEQPRLPVLPAGVFTETLKLPGARIMEDVIVAVSWE